MPSHRLTIATHNRLSDFRRLLTHIRSYDQLFDNILVVVDGDSNYFSEIQRNISEFCNGCSKYEVFHSNQIGGAAVRNYMIQDSRIKNYDYLSFLDDDDLPLKQKFIHAVKYLEANAACVGYTCGYYRYYGRFGRRIISPNKKIRLTECQTNNDIGGFSFVTLNLQLFNDSIRIPDNLKSNQDWYLWIAILKMQPNSYFWKEGNLVGLVYNDMRSRQDRLTLKSSNLSSTYDFYSLLKKEYGLELSSAIDYFYYKHLRNKNFFSFILAIKYNKSIYRLSTRHWRSLVINILYNGVKRLFLSKTSL
jgi:hypothetical protein